MPLSDDARAQLFNCCTHHATPDWKQFDWLVTGGCTEETNAEGESWTNGGEDDETAEFWTVYGHMPEGGLEAITDAYSRTAIDYIANELSKLSGLPVC